MKQGTLVLTLEIKRMIMKCYIKKLDNLDEADQFLEWHKLPKLTKKEIENINRTIVSKEIN